MHKQVFMLPTSGQSGTARIHCTDQRTNFNRVIHEAAQDIMHPTDMHYSKMPVLQQRPYFATARLRISQGHSQLIKLDMGQILTGNQRQA
jgi:hypothetical protein